MKRLPAFCLLLAGLAPAQEKTAIQTAGEEVVVDLVVRDKKGRAVTNLDQSAFTILDEGVPRPISSFRLVKGTEAIAAPNGASASQRLDPLRQIRLVTLIFDSMNQSERSAVRQAALDLLEVPFGENVYMGVFTLGNELQAVQGFTNRRDLLKQAVEKATNKPSSQFSADSEQMRTQAEIALGPNQSGSQDLVTRLGQLESSLAGSTSANPHSFPAGNLFAAIFARSLIEMISFNERTEMAYAGRSTIWALLNAVRGESQLPGRKAIVYFSEGFAIPQGAEEEFEAVISAANRSNLSFYPIDAHGLGAASLNQKATEGLSAAAASSALNAGFSSRDAMTALTQPSTQIALSTDLGINANRMNLQDTLAMLADQTGGFLTANTNDFRAPLERVMEEIDTYYEISYNPRIEKYDGRFRHISVKMARSDLAVQSRAGYFALPPDMVRTSGLNSYEMPLLNALNNPVANPALPFESGGLHFRGDGRLETCGVLIDMPLNEVTLRAVGGGKMTGGLAYVVLVKDVKGAVAKKLQGEMPVELSPDQVLSFKQGRFTDVEYFDAPSGYYTLEVAVMDKETGQTSVRRSALVVPKQSEGLGMSSVALVRKWRPKEPDAAADDPFVVGDKTVTPSLLPKINKSVSTTLPFYTIVYPDSRNPAKPEMFIEFNRDGKVRRVPPAALGAPDTNGRIQYVANAPIEQFEPGNYAVRFVVRQGAESTEEDLAIKLEP